VPPSADVVVAGAGGTGAGVVAGSGGAADTTAQTTLVLTLGRLEPVGQGRAGRAGPGFECLGAGSVWNSTPVESSTATTVTSHAVR
jgi:hypothetical protein